MYPIISSSSYSFIHPSNLYPSICSSIQSSNHQFIQFPIQLFIYLITHLSIQLLTHPSIYPPIRVGGRDYWTMLVGMKGICFSCCFFGRKMHQQWWIKAEQPSVVVDWVDPPSEGLKGKKMTVKSNLRKKKKKQSQGSGVAPVVARPSSYDEFQPRTLAWCPKTSWE